MELLLLGCGSTRQISPPLRLLLPVLSPIGSAWDTLPDELVARVLVLLPFSSLPAARCVCTKWRAVLCSPLFAKLFKACLQERGSSSAWLIEFHQHMLNQAWAYDLSGPAPPRWFHLSFSFLPVYASIKAASGGLVCLGSSLPDGGGRYALFVCNPLTKEWKELPPVPAEPSVVAIEVDRKLGSYRVAAALPSAGVVLTYDSSPDGGGACLSWVAKQSRTPRGLEDAVLCNSILYCLVSPFRQDAKSLFLCDLRPDARNNPPVRTLLAGPNNASRSPYLVACEEEEEEEGGGSRGRRLLLVSESLVPPRLFFHELHVPSMEWRHPVRLPKDASFCLSHSSSLCFPNPRERNATPAAAAAVYVSESGKSHALVGASSLLPLPKSPLSRSKINHRDIVLTSLWFQPRAEAAV